MLAEKTYMKNESVYPGAYTPLAAIEQFMNMHEQESACEPPINMDEFTDHFKLEVSIPGVNRENILIHVHGNVLTVFVLSEENVEEDGKLQIHEFESTRLERHILLPDNADTEFMCAKYGPGILEFYIPKADHPVKNAFARIVAY